MKTDKRYLQWTGIFICLVVLSGITFTASAGTPNGNNLIVQFKGEGTALAVIPDEIMAALPAEPMVCLKMPMIDPDIGFQIGNGYDCVIELGFTPVPGEGGPVWTAYVMEFVGRGLLVTSSHIAVLPNLWDADSAIDLGDDGIYQVTHLVSDLPVAPEQTIYSGTRGFAKAAGRVRVSGANNLDRLPTEGIIVFDYLLVVEFD